MLQEHHLWAARKSPPPTCASTIDLRVVREFQRTVFEVISDESPEAARRIVARLKERQALRRSVDLPTLDGSGGFEDGFNVA